MTSRPAGGGHAFLLWILLAVFFLQLITASPMKSPVFDEPAHIGAGLSYWVMRDFKVNPQHPPLLKELGGLPLFLSGDRFPLTRDDWNSIPEPLPVYFQWSLGRDVIFGNNPDSVMFKTRLPFILMAVLLGVLIVAWGRRLVGTTAAIGALLLYVFDPTVLAHSQLVATDTGFAFFLVAFVAALWWYLNDRTLKRLALCGVALGLMLASKFSAVILLPVVLALLGLAAFWIPAAIPFRASGPVDPFASEDRGQRLVWSVYAFLGMAILAALVIEATYLFSRNPFLYVEGLRRINADHDPSYVAFMAGEFKRHFLTYYLVCYLVKEPVPAIGLLLLGTWAILRRGVLPDLDRAFLLLPPLSLFLVYSIYSDNLGFRYMIPALPFLHLIGGAGLAFLVQEGRLLGKGLAVVLCAWTVLAGTAIYPDHLSYFNELACVSTPSQIGLDGGWRCGPRWLDDSNVDWGQGMKQLRTWLAAHPPQRPLRVGYFASLRPDLFGVEGIKVGVDDLVLATPPAGVYALSAHIAARAAARLRDQYGSGPGNWLLHARLVAVVGHAFYIYDVPGGEEK